MPTIVCGRADGSNAIDAAGRWPNAASISTRGEACRCIVACAQRCGVVPAPTVSPPIAVSSIRPKLQRTALCAVVESTERSTSRNVVVSRECRLSGITFQWDASRVVVPTTPEVTPASTSRGAIARHRPVPSWSFVRCPSFPPVEIPSHPPSRRLRRSMSAV